MGPASLTYRDFMADDTESVVGLWHACGLTRPWNDPHKDIARKLTDRNGAFWVVEDAGDIIATVMIDMTGIGERSITLP